jgi:hypothetical protein
MNSLFIHFIENGDLHEILRCDKIFCFPEHRHLLKNSMSAKGLQKIVFIIDSDSLYPGYGRINSIDDIFNYSGNIGLIANNTDFDYLKTITDRPIYTNVLEMGVPHIKEVQQGCFSIFRKCMC